MNSNIYTDISKNLTYLKNVYHSNISTDVVIRDFSILVNDVRYGAFIISIDGMADGKIINSSILKPLMIRNDGNSFKISSEKYSTKDNIIDICSYISDCLLPQNSTAQIKTFEEVFSAINMGNCVLFIDTVDEAFNFDVKGFKQREINTPSNEIVVRGSQESFVENLRTNTTILRRLINSEKLVLENLSVGKLTKTKIVISYIDGITNTSLISEVRRRISNLDIDYLTSSGQLEQLIQDNPNNIFPQTLATERPDKAINYLLDGRICILVNGNPYALIVPGVFLDFLSSPEDLNIKFQYANLSKIIRLIAVFLSVLLPGIYIAITNYHQDLIPTELLFTIAASRESVPFPTVVEILLMETSFELIREAGLRVPTPLGTTIGIVGALILGDAAVSASLVSPILIIIVAITGICSFSIPDFSLNFTFRILRFIYIILGYIAGFLGIGIGLFIQLAVMCNLETFGTPYLDPSKLKKRSISNYFVLPIWKREKISAFMNSRKKRIQSKISMNWRNKS